MGSSLEQPPPPSGAVGQSGSSDAPPSLSSLSGGAGQSPDASNQKAQVVTQHLMDAEAALHAAAEVEPRLAGIVDQFINTVKPQAGQILFGGQGQPSVGAGAPGGAQPGGGIPPSPLAGLMSAMQPGASAMQ